jgi:polyphosphate kinase
MDNSVEHINELTEKKYINRDLSWISFNYRVLDRAENSSKTVFERLRFLALTANNIDSFFTTRIGNIYNYIKSKKKWSDIAGLKKKALLKKLLQELQEFSKKQESCYLKILKSLPEKQCKIINDLKILSKDHNDFLNQFFKKTILHKLKYSTLENNIDKFIFPTKTLILGIQEATNKKLAFISIPHDIPRFCEITEQETTYFIPIEQIVKVNVKNIFTDLTINHTTTLFRITRNGQFSIDYKESEHNNSINLVKKKLLNLQNGRVIKIEIAEGYDNHLIEVLTNSLKIKPANIFTIKHGLIDFTALHQIGNHHRFSSELNLKINNIPPILAHSNNEDNIFDLIKKQDILLHHPYNSINTVLKLLKESVTDSKVKEIKVTLYRIAKKSSIIDLLLQAAKNGKKVQALFEIKARFDEEQNIKAAEILEKAGCLITYSKVYTKVHSKILTILRKENNKLISYIHISTGNYNEHTADIYTDIALLSADQTYSKDANAFMNFMTEKIPPHKYSTLITAPFNIRNQIIELIDKEIENYKLGLPAAIIIKANSLEDKETIDALYRASQQGVKIQLIIRGICCLIPGIEGLSENIEVYSIIGKFLEHSRIFYFHNNTDPKIYIGSADIMVRSFDKRVETLLLIKDANIKKQIVHILDYNLKDNVNSYIMHSDQTYTLKKNTTAHPFDIHQKFLEN